MGQTFVTPRGGQDLGAVDGEVLVHVIGDSAQQGAERAGIGTRRHPRTLEGGDAAGAAVP
jgi:hypothetical protein